MIAVVDYGMGNLRSAQKALEHVGQEALITSDPAVIDDADKVVLPGVGAFGDCIGSLRSLKLDEAIYRAVEKGKPLLAICIGMQLLFSQSEEFGLHEGLDIIKGRVVRFPFTKDGVHGELKVPHMGWNLVVPSRSSVLFEGEKAAYFYFVHSYYAIPDEDVVIGTADYGFSYACAVQKDNVIGVQFHPEKSQRNGIELLKDFCNFQGV
jgi:glutamine amidotransferase